MTMNTQHQPPYKEEMGILATDEENFAPSRRHHSLCKTRTLRAEEEKSECFSPQHTQQNDDYGWSNWEDTFDETSSVCSTINLVDSLPPQLHPAVSIGMQRVSSCAYFSLAGSVSEADLHSLSSMEYANHREGETGQQQQVVGDANNYLYHDIMMNVLTFLDAKSLAAFSETARRCNFECFYFLQLQLQRALLGDNLVNHSSNNMCSGDNKPTPYIEHQSSSDDRLAAIAGSWTISRLASLDKQEAHDVVQEYLDSNSTLRTMPLSHSLAYIREVLRRHGLTATNGAVDGINSQQTQAFSASAALLIGLVGAAVMSGNVNVEVVESFGTEIPNMLFKVGFVGSLMGAARHQWENKNKAAREHRGDDNADRDVDTTQPTNTATTERPDLPSQPTMRQTAEHMARTMQELLQQVRLSATSGEYHRMTPPAANHGNGTNDGGNYGQITEQRQVSGEASISRRMYEAFRAASGRPEGNTSSNHSESQAQTSQEQQLSPNPYDHPPGDEIESETISRLADQQQSTTTSSHNGATKTSENLGAKPKGSPTANSQQPVPQPKMPSGCVGAYFRAIHRASKGIRRIVQQQRRDRFEALPDKDFVARSFIDACCSDDSFDLVIDLVQRQGIMDADGFYLGSDGTETCALHASAFHGATKVLEFLCGGIDERDPSKDEGLCNVDIQDANLWTALHFAAGGNVVESARILAEQGAKLNCTASNGYTPLQWAQRLSNHEVVEELRRRLEETDPYHASNNRWMTGASQPLSMIAHRFFAMIPTQ